MVLVLIDTSIYSSWFPPRFLSVAAGKSVCIIENSFYFNYIRANQPFYKTSPHTRHWHPSHIRDQNQVHAFFNTGKYHLQVKCEGCVDSLALAILHIRIQACQFCCPISCCSWMKLFKSNVEVYILGADLNKQKINCRTEGLCT